jgi:hypothetical protein
MRINGNNMELIKQLDEQSKTAMDQNTFDRLVKFATDDVIEQYGREATNTEILDVIYGLVENVAGFEDQDDAVELANRVLAEVLRNL